MKASRTHQYLPARAHIEQTTCIECPSSSAMFAAIQRDQLASKLSLNQYLALLGISPTIWRYWRHKHRHIGLDALAPLALRRPHMGEDILRYLRERALAQATHAQHAQDAA